jgi:hypothetical protein
MHNLTGIFVQREPEEIIDNIKMYCFSIIYPKKKRIYLSDNENEIKTWIGKIQKAMGYTDITDIYDVKVRALSLNFLGKTWKWKVWPCQAWNTQGNWAESRYQDHEQERHVFNGHGIG